MVVQVGNHDDHPPIDECVEILQTYRERFVEQFPNMQMVSCSIHLDEQDEGTPHLQMYYIPVKTKAQHEAMGCSKKWSGMDIQPSLTGALEQMGYTNDATVLIPKKDENGNPILDENGEQVMVEKHDYKNGAMAQWQRDFNGLLDQICLEHDIAIDHYMRGKKVEHQDTRDYYEGKIGKETARAMHDRDKAEGKLTETLLKLENTEEKLQKAQEKAEKLQVANNAMEARNEALRTDNDAVKKERDTANKERDDAIKERNDAREEAKTLKEKMEAVKKELTEWASKLQGEIVGIFRKLNSARRIANASPWLSKDTRSRISQNADEIADRTEKAVEKPMSNIRDYSNAYDKLGKELRKAGDLEQVARGKMDIDEAEDGWDYDD